MARDPGPPEPFRARFGRLHLTRLLASRVQVMTRGTKAGCLLSVDSALIVATLGAAGRLVSYPAVEAPLLPGIVPLLAVGVIASCLSGVALIRLRDYGLAAVLRTAVLATALAVSARAIYGHGFGAERATVFAMGFFMASVLSRIAMAALLVRLYHAAQDARPVILYGAGTTGQRIAAALRGDRAMKAVAFVDDNAALHGLTIAGLRVHTPRRIAEIAARSGAARVILAMPALPAARRAELARRIAALGLEVRALPAFAQLLGESTGPEALAQVSPADILARAQVTCDARRLAGSYAGRSVLVTGAGGSIGSELCRQILAARPRRLVLLDIAEHALFQAERALRADPTGYGVEIVPVLGSVADGRLIRDVIRDREIDVILHAAAYKHVPLVEANALSGLGNNVLGTQVLAREAAAAGICRFILISSDKAVRPAGVMGASKRLAELVIQDFAARSPTTRFAAVRFGNVLGSSGSVVPVFRDQIAAGGPLTLTDIQATRYFMTLEEAVHLVLVAGAEAAGGEIFVLDMGAPVRIADLARKMIEGAGHTLRDAANPEGDIEIRVTGLRPGERRHEPRMTGGAHPSGAHPAILKVDAPTLSEIEIAGTLQALRAAIASGDADDARRAVAHALASERRDTGSGLSDVSVTPAARRAVPG